MTDAHQPEISRSIFREAHDAFFILQPADLQIFDVNPAAQRLTGLRRKQLLSMSLEDLLDTGDAKAISDLIEACQTTARFVGAADYVLKVAGGTLAVQISASRIHT